MPIAIRILHSGAEGHDKGDSRSHGLPDLRLSGTPHPTDAAPLVASPGSSISGPFDLLQERYRLLKTGGQWPEAFSSTWAGGFQHRVNHEA